MKSLIVISISLLFIACKGAPNTYHYGHFCKNSKETIKGLSGKYKSLTENIKYKARIRKKAGKKGEYKITASRSYEYNKDKYKFHGYTCVKNGRTFLEVYGAKSKAINISGMEELSQVFEIVRVGDSFTLKLLELDQDELYDMGIFYGSYVFGTIKVYDIREKEYLMDDLIEYGAIDFIKR